MSATVQLALLSDSSFMRRTLSSILAQEGVSVSYLGDLSDPSVDEALRSDCGRALIGTVAGTLPRLREAVRRLSRAGLEVAAVTSAGSPPPYLSILQRDGLGDYIALEGEENPARTLAEALRRRGSVLRGASRVLRRALQDAEVDARDLQILTELSAGRQQGSVAVRLRIGERTVQGRLARMMRRHGVSSQFQLGAWANAMGLVDPFESPPGQS